eukprot:3441596-Amphidinium_carterae.1
MSPNASAGRTVMMSVGPSLAQSWLFSNASSITWSDEDSTSPFQVNFAQQLFLGSRALNKQAEIHGLEETLETVIPIVPSPQPKCKTTARERLN